MFICKRGSGGVEGWVAWDGGVCYNGAGEKGVEDE